MHGDPVRDREGLPLGDLHPGGVEGRREVLHGTARDLGQVDAGQPQAGVVGALGRELHEPLDHGEQPVGAGLCAVDEVLELVGLSHPERVDEALQGGQRGPEVVREGGVEGVLGFLDRLELGAVAGHLGVAGEASGAVVQRGDHHLAPEPGAVLAEPPPRVPYAAAGPGLGQQRERQPGATVLLGVEHREAAADRLLGGVALEPFGPEVPGLDDALRVQRDDRVVDDLADQQPQALLAGSHPLLELVVGGEVPGDLGVAGQLPVAVAQRGDHHVAPEPGAVLADPPARCARPGPPHERGSATRSAARRGGPPRCRTSRSCGRSPPRRCSP